jgi:O-antigen/teichoic acid export membrane protein
MKDQKRRVASRMRAEKYAPRPQGSWLVYGVVGVVLGCLALVAVGRFYDLSPLAYPMSIAAVLLAVFMGSIVLRSIRSRRHSVAHRREYDKAQIE